MEAREVAPVDFFINDGTGARTSLNLYGIRVMTDSVFTVFDVDAVDEMAAKGLATKTVSAGTTLFVAMGKKITAYTLASGSVMELVDYP